MWQLLSLPLKEIRRIFNNFPFIMMLLSPTTHKIILANKAAYDFYGYSNIELTNLPYNKLNGRNNIPFPKLIKQNGQNNKFIKAYTKHKTKGNRIVNVEVFADIIYVENTKLILVIVNQSRISDKDINNQSNDIKNVINSSFLLSNQEISKNLKLIAKKFKKIIESDKLYLQSNLSIEKVAAKLKTNRSYLSKAINNTYGVNFRSYINKMRIDEAIKIIRNDIYPYYTIEGIAKTVGFNDRTAFIMSFKKFMDCTPSEFIKIYKKI